MDIGDKVFVTNVLEQEGDWKSNYKTRKKAQMLKLTGHIIEINANDKLLIKYSFGNVIHGGEIGFDCFLTKNEAENRIKGLNEYFLKDNRLIED